MPVAQVLKSSKIIPVMLLGRFILHAFSALASELPDDVLGVHHGDDGVQITFSLELWVDEERLCYGGWISQTSSFNN